MREELHAITDAEHRPAAFDDVRRQERRAWVVDRVRTAGEDERFGIERQDLGRGRAVGEQFAVHTRFTHLARDEL